VTALAIEYLDGAGLRARRAEVLTVYQHVYADQLADPFRTPALFWSRLEVHAGHEGFSMVAGRVGDDLVGFALGRPLPPGSRWWARLQGPHRHDTDFLREDGHRTFALNELMVHPTWRGRGFGRTLHDAVLTHRPEQRATLLVRQDNEPARSAYPRWGWQAIGQIQPAPDLPFFDVLMRQPAAGVPPGTHGRGTGR